MLKELRRIGFTCPGGRYFPPNDGEFHFDCRLWEAAASHSQDMGHRNYFRHVTPGGLDPRDRTELYGFPTLAEDIAAGNPTAAETLEQWKGSDSDCINMMDPNHNRMGVEYAFNETSDFEHYWTQLFGLSFDQVATSCYTTGMRDDFGSSAPALDRNEQYDDVDLFPPCYDVAILCPEWALEGFCEVGNEHQAFMHESCKKSCGWCGSVEEEGNGTRGDGDHLDEGGSADPPSRAIEHSGELWCADEDAQCLEFMRKGFCADGSLFQEYMHHACRMSCGVCA